MIILSAENPWFRIVAFLVIKDDLVRLLNVDHDSTMDKLVDYIPQIFDFIKTFNKDSTKENKK